jgi:hypothetical protein
VFTTGLPASRVAGDLDGDGRQDIGVYREGGWYVLTSASGFDPGTPLVFFFGGAGGLPILAP